MEVTTGKESAKELKILICTTNLGNKEPSKECIESWIPYDGIINTTSSNYPIAPLPQSFFQEEEGSPFFHQVKKAEDIINTDSYLQVYDNQSKQNHDVTKNIEEEKDGDDDEMYKNSGNGSSNHTNNTVDEDMRKTGNKTSNISEYNSVESYFRVDDNEKKEILNKSINSDLSNSIKKVHQDSFDSYYHMYDNISKSRENNVLNKNIDEKEKDSDENMNNDSKIDIIYENLRISDARSSITYLNSIKSDSKDSYFKNYDVMKSPDNKDTANTDNGKNNGDINEKCNKCENRLKRSTAYTNVFKNAEEKDRFDIIVIGMQEAVFLEGSKSSLIDYRDNDSQYSDSDSSSTSSMSTPNATKKTKKKNKLKTIKKTTEQLLLPFYAMATDTNHLDKDVIIQDPSSVLGGTKILQKTMERRCPSYKTIVHNQRGEMRMIVLIQQRLENNVEYVDCHGGNTGIGNFIGLGTRMPNKV